MVQLSEAAFTGVFAYAGYKTMGRWLKFSEDTAKRFDDAEFMGLMDGALARAVQEGQRAAPDPGEGAAAGGQGHLWADWKRLPPKQRITFLLELAKVLRWSGQAAGYKGLRKLRAGASWRAPLQRTGGCGGAQRLWQVDEPLPLLAAEPALMARPAAEAAALRELVSSQEGRVVSVVEAAHASHMAGLGLASRLTVAEASRRTQALREQLQGGLGLSVGGRAARGQQLLAALRALRLDAVAGSSAAEEKAAAAADLEEQVAARVAEAEARLEERKAEAAARARREAFVRALQVRSGGGGGGAPLGAVAAAGLLLAGAEEIGAALGGGAEAAADAAAPPQAPTAAAEALRHRLALVSLLYVVVARADLAPEARETLSEVVDLLQHALGRAAAPAQGGGGDAAAAAGGEGGDDPAGEVSELLARLTGLAQETAAAAAAAAAAPEGEEGEDGEGEEGEGGGGAEAAAAVAAELADEVAEAVAAQVARLEADQRPVLEALRAKERAGLVLERFRAAEALRAAALTAQEAAAPQAEGEGDAAQAGGDAREAEDAGDDEDVEGGGSVARPTEEAAAAVPPPQAPAPPPPGASLLYRELFLRQLSNRPLAAAVPEVEKLLAGGLAADVQLDKPSEAAATQVARLLEEMELIDRVLKLELGPGACDTLGEVRAYAQGVLAAAVPSPPPPPPAQEEAEEEGGEGKAEGEEGAAPGSAAAAPAAGASEAVVADAEADARLRPSEREVAAAKACEDLSTQLLDDGIVLLELSPLQYRKLGALREAVAQLRPGMPPSLYDRVVAAIRDAFAQLGPIGAAVEARLAASGDERTRGLLAEQQATALQLFARLKAFLAYEDEARAPALRALGGLKAAATGAAVGKSGGMLTALLGKADSAEADVLVLRAILERLESAPADGDAAAAPPPSSEALDAAKAAVLAFGQAVDTLRQEGAQYAGYAALRERALGSASAPVVAEEQLLLPPLEEITPELSYPVSMVSEQDPETLAAWEERGHLLVARGKAAAVLIATGTLPADADAAAPAATAADAAPTARVAADVGLPSGKCLLQLWAERILGLQRQAALAAFGPNSPPTRPVHWYIMTSRESHASIEGLLRKRRFFGLSPSQVHLFTAERGAPCVSEALKVLQSSATRLALAPLGSGDVVTALDAAGMLAHMARSGVSLVEVHAIEDNLLALPADPLLLGYVAAVGLEAAAKVAEPAELAGAYVAAMAGGAGVEVSEDVTFLAPCIGVYCFTSGALRRLAAAERDAPAAGLRLHPAAAIPTRSAAVAPPPVAGQNPAAARAALAAAAAAAARPGPPTDGYALTRVLSDAFVSPALAGAPLGLLGVCSDSEFAPVWGRGALAALASPGAAVSALLSLHTGWVEKAGGIVEAEEGVEVSPLVSYAGEGLEEVVHAKTFAEPLAPELQGAAIGGSGAATNLGGWFAPVALGYAAVAALALAKSVGGRR